MDLGVDAPAGNVSGQVSRRRFNVVLRGYDRRQVDEHLKDLEDQARQHRDQAHALQGQLSSTSAGLGSRIEELLRVAEEQATGIVGEAEAAASELRESATREQDEILATSKRQADEIRSQAQRILEDSKAQRAQAEAEFESQLASRREESERQEAERLAAVQASTQKLVTEAEQRAATAEQRAAEASAQADHTRREAEQHSKQLVSDAKKSADQIVAQAKAQADQLLADTRNEIGRHWSAAQRDADELTTQTESISSHLAQIRQLLGTQLPTADKPAKPAQPAAGSGPPTPASMRVTTSHARRPGTDADENTPAAGNGYAAPPK